MRTLAIVNQKGGCGKTTTAINLAAVYARRGMRTLLVDLDPQSHCAAGLGVPEATVECSIAEALRANLAEFDPSDLVWEVARNFSLAPSAMRLAALEAPGGGLHELPDRDRRLEQLLALMADDFDLCLIDCPPTIGLLTFNALRATREVLIPVETSYFAMRGAEKQWETIQRVIQRIGRPISCHLVPTMHEVDSDLSRDILAALRRTFAGQIVPIEIRRHDALRRAASMGQAVTEFAPDSAAQHDFEQLADWLDEHRCGTTIEIEVQATSVAPLMPRDAASASDDHARGDAAPAAPAEGRFVESGRAAELAGRLRALADRTARYDDGDDLDDAATGNADAVAAIETTPPIPADAPATDGVSMRVGQPLVVADEPEPTQYMPHRLQHLFGVRETSQGVLFVQPYQRGQQISIAGDFNIWSPTATPLVPNEALGVAQALVRIPAGRYRYRVVVDGRWAADAFNRTSELNEHGEHNSVVEIHGTPQTSGPASMRPTEEYANVHAARSL